MKGQEEMAASSISTTRLQRITAMLQTYLDQQQLAGMAALVSHRGRVVYENSMGMMDLEAAKPMQLDTIFRIASMTKPVTSVAAMLLYEQGAFHLNTPVSKFIPSFKDVEVFVSETSDGLQLEKLAGPLTMRHLFTHTSGLGYANDPQHPVDRLYQQRPEFGPHRDPSTTLKDIVLALTRLPLKFQPGTRWHYSLSIDVIGHIVEIISGQPLDRFFEQNLFKPLTMPDTAFYVPAEKTGRVAEVYGHVDGQPNLQRIENLFVKTLPQPPTYLNAGGGLFSTLHDYARFAQMLVNGGELDGVRLLSPTTVAMMETNQAPAAALPYGFAENDLYHAGYGYSLGMRVLMEVAASGMAGSEGEFGWDGAFSTYFWIDRHEQLFGVLMVQHSPNAYYPIANQFKALAYQALY
jgi:CubicO group peptidase (beta-lactamase class C family)